MKKVITYGTYDCLHYGHINLLRNARKLGDYLIVGITSEAFDQSRGKIDVRQSLVERIEAVRATGLADKIIVEEYEGQKIADIERYGVDIFTVGSDWEGKFDYLKKYCEVVYLPRTQGISSTEIRTMDNPVVRLGIVGEMTPSERFINECKAVSGIDVVGITGHDNSVTGAIADRTGISCFESRDALYDECDAVYIVDRIDFHNELITEALHRGKHVICEAPIFLRVEDAARCYDYAHEHGLVLFEGIKTRYFPGYKHLLLVAESGKIGRIKDVEVSFSQKLGDIDYSRRNKYQGSLYDLGGYIFLPVIQLLGRNIEDMHIYTSRQNDFDVFTKGIIKYPEALATFKAGLGVKTEGQLIITGTEGYIYVPAPWWKTDYFELRHEDLRDTRKYFWQYEGEGFRYEIVEFMKQINDISSGCDGQYTKEDSMAITDIIERFDNGEYSLF